MIAVGHLLGQEPSPLTRPLDQGKDDNANEGESPGEDTPLVVGDV